MLTRTSTIRSELAVRAVVVALMAGMLAAPAAAETNNRRWLPIEDAATRPGNVEQGSRQVNHRYDGHDRGQPPAWLIRPGKADKKRARQGHVYPTHSPRHAGRNDHRRDDYYGGGRRYDQYYVYSGKHNHGYERSRRIMPVGYSYSFVYVQPRPRVVFYPVPYRVRGYYERRDLYVQGGPVATCGGGYSDGGRYVMGGSHEPGGTILGGIVGAAIGSQIGGGNGRLAAMGVGTLFGALVGRDIGRSMDDADRAYAVGSFGHAMEYAPTCSTIAWNNPGSGSNGTVTPTQTYEPEPGRYCREFQQEVTIGGQIQDAYGTACRQPDGSWEIVTE